MAMQTDSGNKIRKDVTDQWQIVLLKHARPHHDLGVRQNVTDQRHFVMLGTNFEAGRK